MIPDPLTMTMPMRMDEHGVIRIGGTRVTFESIINHYLQDQSPENLHEGFPTVSLADVYAVIAYFLAHRHEMEAYLKWRDEETQRIRREWEAKYPPKVTREELLKRLEARKNDQDT
jgi:uncharacterized protein (DUF433 family)